MLVYDTTDKEQERTQKINFETHVASSKAPYRNPNWQPNSVMHSFIVLCFANDGNNYNNKSNHSFNNNKTLLLSLLLLFFIIIIIVVIICLFVVIFKAFQQQQIIPYCVRKRVVCVPLKSLVLGGRHLLNDSFI